MISPVVLPEYQSSVPSCSAYSSSVPISFQAASEINLKILKVKNKSFLSNLLSKRADQMKYTSKTVKLERMKSKIRSRLSIDLYNDNNRFLTYTMGNFSLEQIMARHDNL